VSVTVVAPLGASQASPASQFSYAPAVTKVRPNSGSFAGGKRVVISGTNFTGASAVHFGSRPAPQFKVTADKEIIATSPQAPVGTVDITVTGPGGTSPVTARDVYTFK
jgi:hypothetical protein